MAAKILCHGKIQCRDCCGPSVSEVERGSDCRASGSHVSLRGTVGGAFREKAENRSFFLILQED